MEAATDPFALADQSAAALAERTGRPTHDVAVVLGSGWGPAADRVGPTQVEVATTDLPGFPVPTVAGHGGALRSVDADGTAVLVFVGRVHRYEGNPVEAVVHGVRTAAAAGCRAIILTNAAGCLRPEWSVGTAVLLRDHLNLTGASPLTGPEPPPPHAARFVDLTEVYSARLRKIALELEPGLPEGVYAGLNGPHYETPAEIRMLQTMGADLVGMSTVLEAIAARHVGLEVLGLTLVTNPAAGLAPAPLDHHEVLAAGGDAGGRLGDLLGALVRRM